MSLKLLTTHLLMSVVVTFVIIIVCLCDKYSSVIDLNRANIKSIVKIKLNFICIRNSVPHLFSFCCGLWDDIIIGTFASIV